MGNKVFSCQHPSSPAIKVKTEGQQNFVSACEVQKAGLRRERKKEKKKKAMVVLLVLTWLLLKTA